MMRHNFRNLKVYKRAIEYSTEIYKTTGSFPKEEVHGLTSQIRRAAISIALNIAEGSGNSSEREFKRFLEISLRSAYELMACLEIALKLKYLSETEFEKLAIEADEIAAMITGFSKSLESSNIIKERYIK
ncbi:MAG TPA: four helix bundle protein [Syntrophorhabdaceae bacterium]|nr:four helix bundle protein [Syntrophorhabdaceae bacterium]